MLLMGLRTYEARMNNMKIAAEVLQRWLGILWLTTSLLNHLIDEDGD